MISKIFYERLKFKKIQKQKKLTNRLRIKARQTNEKNKYFTNIFTKNNFIPFFPSTLNKSY